MASTQDVHASNMRLTKMGPKELAHYLKTMNSGRAEELGQWVYDNWVTGLDLMSSFATFQSLVQLLSTFEIPPVSEWHPINLETGHPDAESENGYFIDRVLTPEEQHAERVKIATILWTAQIYCSWPWVSKQ
ncbi:hypothetical protein OAM67_01440 [bacterium]|nr:hypothetical protein [bacterium]